MNNKTSYTKQSYMHIGRGNPDNDDDYYVAEFDPDYVEPRIPIDEHLRILFNDEKHRIEAAIQAAIQEGVIGPVIEPLTYEQFILNEYLTCSVAGSMMYNTNGNGILIQNQAFFASFMTYWDTFSYFFLLGEAPGHRVLYIIVPEFKLIIYYNSLPTDTQGHEEFNSTLCSMMPDDIQIQFIRIISNRQIFNPFCQLYCHLAIDRIINYVTTNFNTIVKSTFEKEVVSILNNITGYEVCMYIYNYYRRHFINNNLYNFNDNCNNQFYTFIKDPSVASRFRHVTCNAQLTEAGTAVSHHVSKGFTSVLSVFRQAIPKLLSGDVSKLLTVDNTVNSSVIAYKDGHYNEILGGTISLTNRLTQTRRTPVLDIMEPPQHIVGAVPDIQQGGNGDEQYKQKYLKYKNKYLLLKKHIKKNKYI